jgi:hypothetical protein
MQTNLIVVADSTAADKALLLDPTYPPALCTQLNLSSKLSESDEKALSAAFKRGFPYAGDRYAAYQNLRYDVSFASAISWFLLFRGVDLRRTRSKTAVTRGQLS